MNDHLDELLPFYINQTLDEAGRAQVQAHLSVCPACRAKLAGWERIASVVIQPYPGQPVTSIPPLSPLLTASLLRRPSLRQAARSALTLIWTQRVFISQTWLLPSLGSLVILAALGALMLESLSSSWARLPLFTIIPMAAALVTAFLYTFDDDLAGELILATPTSLPALLFARLTLALSAISLLGFMGSLPAALTGHAPAALFKLVATWLGPMLVLSALTTVFSIFLHPRLASGAALTLWGSLLILLVAERTGMPIIQVSLLWLVEPGWALLAAQVLLASLLWLAAWWWLSRNPFTPTHLQEWA
jgi:hypothetical protein